MFFRNLYSRFAELIKNLPDIMKKRNYSIIFAIHSVKVVFIDKLDLSDIMKNRPNILI